MTNKDFIRKLAKLTGESRDEVKRLVEGFTGVLGEELEDGDTAMVLGFGSFEMRKKMERIVNNPLTKQRQLVPPKLTINFKASPALKDKAL